MSATDEDELYGHFGLAFLISIVSAIIFLITADPRAAITLIFFAVLGGIIGLMAKSEWVVFQAIVLEVLGMWGATRMACPLDVVAALLGLTFLFGRYRIRLREGLFWRALSSALVSLAIGFLAAAAVGVYIRNSGVSAAKVGEFQNRLVEICLLLRFLVKPWVVIAITLIGLSLSFLIHYPLVEKLGAAVTLVGFAARTMTVFSSFLFVTEDSAANALEEAFAQLVIEYKEAEMKVNVAKAEYFAAVYANSLLTNEQSRPQLAARIHEIYRYAAKKSPTHSAEYFESVMSIWAETLVPRRETTDEKIFSKWIASDGSKAPVWLKYPATTVSEYVEQRDSVDAFKIAAQNRVNLFSKRTTEVREATRQILQNILASFIPELKVTEVPVFVDPLYDRLTDGLCEGIADRYLEEIDPTLSIEQAHEAIERQLNGLGVDIEAAIARQDSSATKTQRFDDYLDGLVRKRMEKEAEAQRLAAKEFEAKEQAREMERARAP